MQYYIQIGDEQVPVSEEAYYAYKRPAWREAKRRQRDTADGVIPLSLDGLQESPNFDIAAGIDIHAIVEDKERLEALFDALDELTAEERELITDIFYRGKTVRQIAAELGLKAHESVRKRRDKILAKLRESKKLRDFFDFR